MTSYRGDWTLQPPTTPGLYDYREERHGAVAVHRVMLYDGKLCVDGTNIVIDVAEWDGEWRQHE